MSTEYSAEARRIAAKILAMPADERRALVNFITNADHQKQAIDDGDWSGYALLSALRAKNNLPG